MQKSSLLFMLGTGATLLTLSPLLTGQQLLQAQPLSHTVVLAQTQDPPEVQSNCDKIYGSRSLAYNAAKERAKIPLSQTFVDQWTVGDDEKRRGVSSNYVYIDTKSGTLDQRNSALAAMGLYQKFDTPQGPRIIVEHTYDPRNTNKHFHAGQPKGDPSNKNYDFRTQRYAAVGGAHHLCY
jgi:hypothetical protein